jgi:hypothetical protein
MRRRGAKSFVDDLVLSRGVVLSRADLFCDLLRLSPMTRRFVRFRRTYLLAGATVGRHRGRVESRQSRLDSTMFFSFFSPRLRMPDHQNCILRFLLSVVVGMPDHHIVFGRARTRVGRPTVVKAKAGGRCATLRPPFRKCGRMHAGPSEMDSSQMEPACRTIQNGLVDSSSLPNLPGMPDRQKST